MAIKPRRLIYPRSITVTSSPQAEEHFVPPDKPSTDTDSISDAPPDGFTISFDCGSGSDNSGCVWGPSGQETTMQLTSVVYVTHPIAQTIRSGVSYHYSTISSTRHSTVHTTTRAQTTMAAPSYSSWNGLSTVTVVQTVVPVADSPTSTQALAAGTPAPNPGSTGGNNDSGGGTSKGLIAGISAGVGGAALLAIFALVWFILRRRKKKRHPAAAATASASDAAYKDRESKDAEAIAGAEEKHDAPVPPTIFELDTSVPGGTARPVSELPDTGPMPELQDVSAQKEPVSAMTSPTSPVSNLFSISELHPSEAISEIDACSETRVSQDLTSPGGVSQDGQTTVFQEPDIRSHEGHNLTTENLTVKDRAMDGHSGQDAIGRSLPDTSTEFVDALDHRSGKDPGGSEPAGTAESSSRLTDARGSLYTPY